MQKRLLLSLGLLACLLVVGIWQLMASRHSINRDGWAAIKKGMRQQEVQEILRLPPGDHRTADNESPLDRWFRRHRYTADWWGELDSNAKMVAWESNDGLVEVLFDPDGIVVGAWFFEPTPQEQFTDKLYRWLGLPWW